VRIAIIASASGSGKTTLARALAERLGAPWLELDALVHGPGWVEVPDAELRATLSPFLAQPAWVVDGLYLRKLGDLILDAADLVVWLDLPIHIWFPRLLRRSARRIVGRQPLWNGNRETLRGAFWGRDSLFGYALRMHFERRRTFPARLAGRRVIRLRRPRDVDAFLAEH
jgi:adenylate kinase family enzyme